jgi:hypothetical protein
MRRRSVALGAVIVFAILAVVGSTMAPRAPSSGGSPSSAPEGATVLWSDYAADLHTRIDSLTSGRDCPGLQREFDAADANNAATLSRTGHNNAALMDYINQNMKTAGCY